MRGEDDLHLRQHAARQRQQVDAEGEEMVEMHHVRLDEFEEFLERLDEQQVAALLPGVVIFLREEQELIRPPVETR